MLTLNRRLRCVVLTLGHSAAINIDTSEIADCMWMNLEEYAELAESEMNNIIARLALRHRDGTKENEGAAFKCSSMTEHKLKRKPSGSKGGMLYCAPGPTAIHLPIPPVSIADTAQRCGDLLLARGETVALAESSTGGKASAELVAVSGASKFFGDSVVVYSKASKARVLALTDAEQQAARSATEAHALMLAEAVKKVNGTDWGVGETGR